ncbi:MAG TPA: carboxypeptidase-like regulatory domain-containing protein, partial [Candidatus Acidoferrales bacterium]|nr:carboxypeptidase-like regulatory domain-containing protein [Candidatus Acidoferrales bacterium]
MLRIRISLSGLQSTCRSLKIASQENNFPGAFGASALIIFLSVFLLLLTPAASAQEVTGSIVGTVVDPSGAVVSGASVSAREVRRGTVFSGKTDDTGSFRIERVPIGRYEVRVERTGFQTAVKPAF